MMTKRATRRASQFDAQAVRATIALIRNLYLADVEERLSLARDREQRTLWAHLGVSIKLRDEAIKALVEQGEMYIAYFQGRLYACRTAPPGNAEPVGEAPPAAEHTDQVSIVAAHTALSRFLTALHRKRDADLQCLMRNASVDVHTLGPNRRRAR